MKHRNQKKDSSCARSRQLLGCSKYWKTTSPPCWAIPRKCLKSSCFDKTARNARKCSFCTLNSLTSPVRIWLIRSDISSGSNKHTPLFSAFSRKSIYHLSPAGTMIERADTHIALLLKENTAKYFQTGFMIKERKLVKIAKVGNVIEFKNGLTGIVEKVNENSVIVDVTIMDNYRDLELDSLTVVNHKNYKIIKDSY